jgi:energy-coupling factor transporter ATP-binding protein EcfA2
VQSDTIIDVYTAFIERACLTEDHRSELKEKRGFSDQTIDVLKLRSARDENKVVISELESKYGRSLLKDAAILNEKGDPSAQLLQANIIIPYLTEDSRVYLLRPHKFGLKGKGVEVYSEGLLKKISTDKVILTESEFKAVACWQLGYAAVGIPGIASFSKTQFPRLKEIFDKNNIKSVCVVFDREIKNIQSLPNYKKDPQKRWDTQFFAWLMATQLIEEGFHTSIGLIPERFVLNGKADLDGALSQGMTLEDIEDIVRYADEPDEFFHKLEDEGQLILQKKKKSWYFNNTIKEETNHYTVTTRKEKTFEKKIISNFVIRIKNCYFDGEKSIREVYFVNEFGEQSKVFKLGAEEMVSITDFEVFCRNKGNYAWRGSKNNLIDVWEWEISKNTNSMVLMPDHVGKIDSVESDIWLFENVSVIDGAAIETDEFGIVRHKELSFKTRSISSNKDELSILIPDISTEPYDYKTTIQKIVANFKNDSIKICIGWIVANFFLNEVSKQFHSFPFLFLVGRRMSGKTTLARWLVSFTGIRSSGKSITGTSQVGIARYLSYYSSLPVWFDEYRNEAKIHNKDSFLRNVYDRQGSGKGTKTGIGTREEIIRGSILLSGEETPLDNALLTRSIVVRLAKREMKENDIYFELQKQMNKFSKLAYDVLLKRESLAKKFMNNVNECMIFLCKEYELDQRIALNYAIAGCGYMILFGEDDEFVEYLAKHAVEDKTQKDSEQVINIFFGILGSLHAKGDLDDKYFQYNQDKNEVSLYFQGSYNLFSPEYHKIYHQNSFKQDAIRNYLKEEDFYKGHDNVRIKGSQRKCLIFKASELPSEAQFLVTQ